MKTRLIIVVFAALTVCARAELVFQGFMTTANRPLFVLSIDKERTSSWLGIGQTFGGFVIVDFDAKAEVLTVERDGKRQVLRLMQAGIKADSGAMGGVASKPIVISIEGGETFSVSDEARMPDALKAKLRLIAAMVPQPTVTICAPVDAAFDQVRWVFDLCRASGVSRVSFRTQ